MSGAVPSQGDGQVASSGWSAAVGLLVLVAANAHLVYVAVASQPDCVAHLKAGEGTRRTSSARRSPPAEKVAMHDFGKADERQDQIHGRGAVRSDETNRRGSAICRQPPRSTGCAAGWRDLLVQPGPSLAYGLRSFSCRS